MCFYVLGRCIYVRLCVSKQSCCLQQISLLSLQKKETFFCHSCWSFFRQLPKIATTCFFLPTCFSVTKKQQLLPKTTNSRVLTWITDTHGTHRDNFSFFKGLLCFFFLSSLMCRLFVSVPVDELDGDSTKATPKHGYSPMWLNSSQMWSQKEKK